MELRQFLFPLLKWWWLILISTIIAAGSSFIATSQQVPFYGARTTLVIGQAINSLNPTGAEFYLSQQLAQTYADLARREPVQDATKEVLGLTWLPEYNVYLVPNTQLIEIAVTDTDPVRVAAIANELANQLILRTPTNLQQQDSPNRQQFINRELDDLESQIQETKDEVKGLQTELGEIFSAQQIADIQKEITALQAKLNTLQTNYALLLANTGGGAINTLTVIEQASVPSVPIGNNRFFSILTSAAIGFVLAVGAAYVLEYLDDTLKTPEDIIKLCSAPIIGFISDFAGINEEDSREIVVTKYPRSPITESFRILRTNLEFASAAEPIDTLVVTSPSPSDGKTTIATNLVSIIAHGGKKVSLIDADLRRPRVHKCFGLTNNTGLSDVFREQRAISEVTRIIDNPGRDLSVVTSGMIPPNPAELLSSNRMSQILSEFEAHSDITIIDSPPPVVSDAAIIASKASGVILVVQINKSKAAALIMAVEQFRRAGVRIVGIVINRIPRRRAYEYYYYYPAYYPGYYTGDYLNESGNNGYVNKPSELSTSAIRRLFRLPAGNESPNGKSSDYPDK